MPWSRMHQHFELITCWARSTRRWGISPMPHPSTRHRSHWLRASPLPARRWAVCSDISKASSMRVPPNPSRIYRRSALVTMLVFLASALALAAPPDEPLPFRQAINLALQHSGITAIAAANQWHSKQAYQEARNHYLPQLTVGSGLGYSYGFPSPSKVRRRRLSISHRPSLCSTFR